MTNSTTTSSASTSTLSQLLGFERGDYVSVATKGVKVARTISVENLDFEYAAGLLSQEDTWIGAQPVKPSTADRRAKASDVACVRVLYADFDRKEASDEQLNVAIDELSNLLGTPPCSIVESGGGLHPRWKLEEPLDPQDAKGVLNRWKLTVQRVAAENGFKPDSVFDLPRVLRLPGTVNEKYDPPAPVEVVSGNAGVETVPASVVWSKLDTTKGKSPLAGPAASKGELQRAAEAIQESAPVLKPTHSQTLSERAVNVEVQRDLERLRQLTEQGWDGEPWHNTTRDVAFRLAKIAKSPETHWNEGQMWAAFSEAAPRDDEGFDDDRIDQYWTSALERAEGEIYELIGSGDDLFHDDLEGLLEGARVSREPKLDIDDFETSTSENAPRSVGEATAGQRYDSLERPLIPGFGGVSALRQFSTDEAPARVLQRIDAIAEDISDMHDLEHVEYAHPHCPRCFPDHWRGQLYRWMEVNRGKDPMRIKAPHGALGPDEGYYTLSEAASLGAADQIIEGYIPARGVGIIRGRNSAGKTFVAIDMALAVADPDRGEWHEPLDLADRGAGDVHQHGPVLILAGESMLGVRDRVTEAVREKAAPGDVANNFYLRPEVPNFFTGGPAFEGLKRFVLRVKPALVVVDTLQKAASGADQNNASDMAIVYSRLTEIKDAMGGGSVILIAHTDKGDSTTRGSSSLEDDADFVLHAKGGDVRTLSVEKLRDGAPGPDFEFTIESSGDSAVLRPGGASGGAPGSAVVRRDALQNMQKVAVALRELMDAGAPDALFTVKDVTDQADLNRKTVYRALSKMKFEGYVSASIPGSGSISRYRLTPQGIQWQEAQGLAVFMKGPQA